MIIIVHHINCFVVFVEWIKSYFFIDKSDLNSVHFYKRSDHKKERGKKADWFSITNRVIKHE